MGDKIVNNDVRKLSELAIRFKKFGILNKENVKWLIETMQLYIGTDELFFPMIILKGPDHAKYNDINWIHYLYKRDKNYQVILFKNFSRFSQGYEFQ